jgi:hypothetical protein
MFAGVMMAESLDQRICGDCGVVATSQKRECPECGRLLRPQRKRRNRRVGMDLDRDCIEEPDRTFESRLEDCFLMLEWE